MVSLIAAWLLAAVLPGIGGEVKRAPRMNRTAQPVEIKTATVGIRGLALLTASGVANSRTAVVANHDNETIVAILPDTERVPHLTHTSHGVADSYVEIHTAVIAFDDQYQPQVNGWQVKQLRPGLKYVELRGERITFQVDGVNPPTRYGDLRLPKVGGPAIRPSYLQPEGVAAIVEIPRAKKVSVCVSGEGGRADTVFKLDTNGEITIKSASGKSITLPGDAKIDVANMPKEWLETLTAGSDGYLPHFQVYCDMTGAQTCPLPGRVSAAKCEDTAFVMRRPPQERGPGVPNDPYPLADFFCSNSQWP